MNGISLIATWSGFDRLNADLPPVKLTLWSYPGKCGGLFLWLIRENGFMQIPPKYISRECIQRSGHIPNLLIDYVSNTHKPLRNQFMLVSQLN